MAMTGWSLRRRGSFLLTMVLGLVLLADWLFYQQTMGWTAGLFGAALLLAVTLRGGIYLQSWPGRFISAATLGLLAALVIHPGVLPVTLSMLGLITLAIIDRAGWTSNVAAWASRWLNFVVRGTTQALRDTAIQNRWQRKHPEAVRGAAGIAGRGLRAWVLPVLLSIGFVVLFAVANPVVQHRLGDAWAQITQRLVNLGEWLVPLRMLLWLVTGVAVWALLRVRVQASPSGPRASILRRLGVWLVTKPHQRDADPAATPIRVRVDTSATSPAARAALVVRCLVLFNAVFAVQTLLDARYLYGGAALPDGMSYAEYAHRGAYPLVATALLAGLFVLITFRPDGVAQRSGWCRRLVGLWIAQNIVLMASAVWRLSLYVEAYSLTRWRVAAAIWMVLVGLGFAWLIWRILANRDNAWLLQRVFLTAGVVLYAVCFVDLDRTIAGFNVQRCAESGGPGQPIDLDYLEQLGVASLPALKQLQSQAHMPRPLQQQTRAAVRRLERQLNRDLDNWRGWTLRRSWLSQPPTLASTR